MSLPNEIVFLFDCAPRILDNIEYREEFSSTHLATSRPQRSTGIRRPMGFLVSP